MDMHTRELQPAQLLTYVNKLMVISLLQVIQNRSVVEVCQVGHILAFFVLRWVDLAYKILLEVFCLWENIVLLVL